MQKYGIDNPRYKETFLGLVCKEIWGLSDEELYGDEKDKIIKIEFNYQDIFLILYSFLRRLEINRRQRLINQR